MAIARRSLAAMLTLVLVLAGGTQAFAQMPAPPQTPALGGPTTTRKRMRAAPVDRLRESPSKERPSLRLSAAGTRT